jgi:hypothetical protein
MGVTRQQNPFHHFSTVLVCQSQCKTVDPIRGPWLRSNRRPHTIALISERGFAALPIAASTALVVAAKPFHQLFDGRRVPHVLHASATPSRRSHAIPHEFQIALHMSIGIDCQLRPSLQS